MLNQLLASTLSADSLIFKLREAISREFHRKKENLEGLKWEETMTMELQQLKLNMGGLVEVHEAVLEAGKRDSATLLSQQTKFQDII